MDFDQSASDKNLLLTDAILPESIKKETKNWNTIKGYIYIISKKFKAFPGDPERLLMKIGFSDFFTDDARGNEDNESTEENTKREETTGKRRGKRKNLTRLQGFRTTLISFKLHRLILFDERDNEMARGSAYQTEQELQKMVSNKFDPPAVRITFDGEKMKGFRDRPTEWFWVKNGDRGLKKILEWIDKQLYYNTTFEPIFVTRFHDNPTPESTNSESIKPDKEYPDRPPKITSMVVVDGTVKERNEISRTSKAVTAKRPTQRQTQVDDDAANKLIKEKQNLIRKEEALLEKDARFWSNVFKIKKNKYFTDSDMGERDGVKDDGKYPNYQITHVEKADKLEDSPPGLFIVHYKPNVTRAVLRQMTNDEIKFRSDYLPLHEAMDLTDLKHVKEKFKKEYDHFAKKYKYGAVDFEQR